MNIGDVIEIAGVDMRLVNVNVGKQRVTFTPVDRSVKIKEPSKDPKFVVRNTPLQGRVGIEV